MKNLGNTKMASKSGDSPSNEPPPPPPKQKSMSNGTGPGPLLLFAHDFYHLLQFDHDIYIYIYAVWLSLNRSFGLKLSITLAIVSFLGTDGKYISEICNLLHRNLLGCPCKSPFTALNGGTHRGPPPHFTLAPYHSFFSNFIC